ncbi:hydantoinase B/oxoprolinase family protein [Ruficoccus amylovorans]|uniref:Hydantoinase B/oxoprolinase family protein n=1 Tax=Ruficoccus amylovorans TaxID=1804625 RepID=A0A842HBS5_9BACT|nr:hydantoinase B/oxoprolinase family protein [Ruficoccus amylovorans]MBC2593156.1 hydantoinase B/oxoprolinase family protein [Ruficoccus amylovorans]
MWQIGADTGGTFTDLIGLDPAGKPCRAKVLSSGCLRARVVRTQGRQLVLEGLPGLVDGVLAGFRLRRAGERDEGVVVVSHDNEGVRLEVAPEGLEAGMLVELFTGEEAPVVGARVMTGTPGARPLPPIALRLGTTRGTNALLERRGARTLFVVTEGFADLLAIGDQRRPDLFALNIVRPRPLYDHVIEVKERLRADGSVLLALEGGDQLRQRLRRARKDGCEAAAVALLHSYQNPGHEETLGRMLREEGFGTVSLSSELAPFIKLVPRAQTAVTDAYLGPVMEAYLDRVEEAVPAGRLHVMTSAGGLVGRGQFRPKDSLLSGPAGGVVGAASIGRRAGFSKIIAFDMGGTSTDVSRFDGEFSYRDVQRVGDSQIVAPALSIETVAAGGGSICGYDGRSLFVGPQSAGASPGPACYGAGGPLTLTDVNLLAGRLDPEHFGIPVNPEAAETRLAEIIAATGSERETLLRGFLDIANERMADAIRAISVREGYDPAQYALVAFGGAGGLHACPVAENLGIRTVLFPRDAGLLSAYGLRNARMERICERQVLRELEDAEGELAALFEELATEGFSLLEAEGLRAAQCEVRQRVALLRLSGQESPLEVEWESGVSLADAFARRYRQVFGYWESGGSVEVVKLRVVVAATGPRAEEEGFAAAEVQAAEKPRVLADETATLVVDPGWALSRGSAGTFRLDRVGGREGGMYSKTDTGEIDELVGRELFTNRFRRVVEEMGMQLQRTAVSTNVKERLDYSCALLDARGELIANAPHIPVHLGALGLCVRRVAQVLDFRPGDVVVTNHPGFGGSHLPDVTVITPVHDEGGSLIGYVASRAHHAEIGGKRPGSMPVDATTLAEEGVVIAPRHLIRAGDSRFAELEQLLGDGAWPSRNVLQNLADIRAQVAANHRGAQTLLTLAREFGTGAVAAQMEGLKAFSESTLSRVLRDRVFRPLSARQGLDDGAVITVRISAESNGRICIDFSDTSDVHPGNLNATPAIVNSALIYVLRLLVREDIPLNDGLLAGLDIRLPKGMLNPVFDDDPARAPAVMGGNVEVSQRLVDTLLLALGEVACSQGTMNNLVFGDESRSYYETIGGGAGAGNGFAGASGVHVHMTNTAITDPELFEWRYPVRLWRFGLRAGSGGAGQWPGGDGLVREIEFLEPLSVSLLTQRRTSGPEGLAGGNPGEPGRQTLVSPDGDARVLAPSDQFDAAPGQRLRIETPGGGGFGAAGTVTDG